MIYLIDKEFIFIVILNWENPDKVGIVDSLPNFSSVVSQSHREKCRVMGSTRVSSFPLPLVLSLVMLLAFHPLLMMQSK